MNPRSTLVALVAAGCGAGRTAAPPTVEIAHHATRGELVAAPDLDLEAGARMWRALAPTGATYEQVLASIPAEPELRRSMAVALLREADFACNDTVEEWGCADSWQVLAPLDPAATIDDPCLRRFLAVWSLQQLEPDDAISLGEVMVDLASMPMPEDALPRAAFDVAPDDGLRLRMLAAAEHGDQYTDTLESDHARVAALVRLHLPGALAGLDVAAHRDALRPALLDPELDSYTRAALLEGFADDPDDRVTHALAELADDLDCGLAMRAATLLAERGDPSRLPVRPRNRDPEAHLRALCMLGSDADMTAWIGDAGYDTTVTTYDDAPVVDHVDRDDAGFDERLIASSWTCDGLTCTAGSATVTFEPAADGGLELATIESTEEYEGCGC